MARVHVVYDFSAGPDAQPVTIPFTSEEEAAADAAEQDQAVPTVEGRVSALETLLVAKKVLARADLDTAVSVASAVEAKI